MTKDEFVKSLKQHNRVRFEPSEPEFYLADTQAAAVANTLERHLPHNEEIAAMVEVGEKPVTWLLALRRDLALVIVSEDRLGVSVDVHLVSARDVRPYIASVFEVGRPGLQLKSVRIEGLRFDGVDALVIESRPGHPAGLVSRFMATVLEARERTR
jgi:hypothetical protein